MIDHFPAVFLVLGALVVLATSFGRTSMVACAGAGLVLLFIGSSPRGRALLTVCVVLGGCIIRCNFSAIL